MERHSSLWLRVGEWLLGRRWWWIGLAILSIFGFEYAEYRPLQEGLRINFFVELASYGVILPLSTGLALSALASSRNELAWSAYVQSLKRNLDLQLQGANSHAELASVILQFARVVLPVAGLQLDRYDQPGQHYQTMLYWSANKEAQRLCSISECSAERCACCHGPANDELMLLQPCRNELLYSVAWYCMPFVFSDSRVAAARFCFSTDGPLALEHSRLLTALAPEIAAAFHRVQLHRLIQTRDESLHTEQHRIARDVHDTLGHSLAYLRLRLDQISLELNQAEQNNLQQEVTVLRDVAKEAYEQMREILVALSPTADTHLDATLAKYAERIAVRADFQLDIRQSGRPRSLPPPIQRNVINIFREILTNIENHAQARYVQLTFHWRSTHLEIRVKDDGVGFDPALPVEDGHFGLNNMRERAQESQIHFSLSSQVDQGTELLLQIPYEEAV